MYEMVVSLVAVTGDSPRMIVEVDIPVLAVREQPESVEDALSIQ